MFLIYSKLSILYRNYLSLKQIRTYLSIMSNVTYHTVIIYRESTNLGTINSIIFIRVHNQPLYDIKKDQNIDSLTYMYNKSTIAQIKTKSIRVLMINHFNKVKYSS